MKMSHLCALASLVLASHASASEPAPTSAAPEAATVQDQDLPRVPGRLLERLRELEQKDPAAFRDLLRRSLAARLLRQEQGDGSSADLPVELAGDLTPAHR